jgi:hypothetical protein
MVRTIAADWRAAGQVVGESGAGVAGAGAALAAAWAGPASRAASDALGRSALRADEVALALDEAAAVLDRYAEALDEARVEIDRLRVARADAAESMAMIAGIDRHYDDVIAGLSETANALGSRLHDLAARSGPGSVGPDTGPDAVVRQNANDTGEVDWLTHLALTHPNLDTDQRVWILEHRDRFDEQLEVLVSAASNPAVTDDVVSNYVDEIERRNTRHHLAGAFATHRLEFVDALLLPTVIAIATSAAFRQGQVETQLFVAVVDAALPGTPPAQYASPPIVSRGPVPLGFLSRRDYGAFTRELPAGLHRAGYDDAVTFFRGSSVTRTSYHTGRLFDDHSDSRGNTGRDRVA